MGRVSLCMIVLITLPVNLQTQLITSITVVTVMALIKVLKGEGTWRLVALAFGTSIVLRYVYWRTTNTLPPVNQLANFIPGLLLYLAEMYSVAMLALSLFIVATPLPSRPSRAAKNERFPHVDVFVPSYNEDAGLLETRWPPPRPWIIRPRSCMSGCSTTAAPCRSAIPASCSKPRRLPPAISS